MEKDFIPHHFWLKNGAGFTLIEIVLAIFIMSLAIIPIMQVFPTTLMVSKDTEEMTRAACLAEGKIEEVKGKLEYDFRASISSDGNFADDGFPDYRFKVEISDIIPDELKAIKTTVWCDRDGNEVIDDGENRIVLDTKIAKRS